MNDAKRVYALGAGIAAVILVIALALSVLSNQQVKTTNTIKPTAAVRRIQPTTAINRTTKQVVTIPVATTRQTIRVTK